MGKELILFNKQHTTADLVSRASHSNIQKEIQDYLNEDRFNYLITVDNIAQVKKDNADINKTSKLMMEISKDIITLETGTVNQFKENIREYKVTLEAKRIERVTAIEVYENETKETLRGLLNDYALAQIIKLNIREDFNNVMTNDLVKLGNITAKGALAKSGKDGVDAKVQKCLQLQNRYDLRISNLKVVCYEQGLTEPLNESHIQGIVFEDNEDKYQESLKSLISSEIERFEKIKAKIAEDERKKAESKAKENSDKLLKVQLEEKYLSLIPNADEGELDNIQRELTNYSSSILVGINTEISKRVNAIYFQEDQAKRAVKHLRGQDGVSDVKIIDDEKIEYNHTPSSVAEEIHIVEDITPREDGKKVVKVVKVSAMFEFMVKDGIPSEKILQRAKEVIEDALKETKMFESFIGVDLV